MKEEKPGGYTGFPQPGENYLVSAARVITWLMAQPTPEQFRKIVKEVTGKTPPKNFRIELSPDWAARAVIPLIDSHHGILIGVRLDHPTLQTSKESFVWQSEGITFTISTSEEGENITLELSNHPRSFLRRMSSLEIFITNIYQEAEYGRSSKFCPTDSNVVFIPIPVLVENTPSVLVWITSNMENFTKSTYSPPGFSIRRAIEGILEKKGF